MTFGRDVGVQTWPDILYENNNRSVQGIAADFDSLRFLEASYIFIYVQKSKITMNSASPLKT